MSESSDKKYMNDGIFQRTNLKNSNNLSLKNLKILETQIISFLKILKT